MVLNTVHMRRPGASRGARSRQPADVRGDGAAPRVCPSSLRCEFFKIKRGGYIFVVKQNRQHRKTQESKNRLESLCLEMTTVDRLRTSFQVLVLSLSLHFLSVHLFNGFLGLSCFVFTPPFSSLKMLGTEASPFVLEAAPHSRSARRRPGGGVNLLPSPPGGP